MEQNAENLVNAVEKTTVEADGKSETITVDTALVEKLTKELDDFEAELKNKVYPVKVETDGHVTGLIDFIENHAPWKNMEALGITEVSKVLREQQISGLKSGNIFLASLPIQAISFFLSKVESKGLKHAERHLEFVKPIDNALKLIKMDNDRQNQLNSELSAAEQGISIEPHSEKGTE
jgi:hypothetical protein